MTTMRISDLLASEVHAGDGRVLGRVREIRIVQDGPVTTGVQAAFRVDALLVGKGSLGVRLGFHLGNTHGPWLLNLLFRRSHRRVKTIPMTDVREWDLDARVVRLH
jgi:hypothetical protein